jgi:hypothetical protein
VFPATLAAPIGLAANVRVWCVVGGSVVAAAP